MKKSLLLTAAVVLTAVVFFGCQNPATNVVIQPNSAPEVDGSLVKAEAYPGGVLLSWETAEEVYGYDIWRRTLKDAADQEVIPGTEKRLFMAAVPIHP